MKNERTAATLVGVLYIIGTAAGIASKVVSHGVSSTPESLAALALNPGPAMLTATLVLIMGVALAIIPAVLYPIVKRQSESLAVGYVIFRGGLEMFTYMATAFCWLSLPIIAQQAAKAATSAVPLYSGLGDFAMAAQDPITAFAAIVFSIGGLMLCYAMYRMRLIPRWLALWGIVGAVPYLAAGIINIFAGEPVLLYMPLALQEMVMAVWLIVKGFSSGSARLEKGLQPLAA